MSFSQEVVAKEDEDDDEEESDYVPPISRLITPHDVASISPDADTVQIIGTLSGKVTKIAGLEGMVNLRNLILRSCLVSTMEGVETLHSIEKLELYDNQLLRISSLEALSRLTILDISFNAIRDMSPVRCCSQLQELYIAQNKLRKIEGIRHLTNLRILDLGANRIREMEEIEGLVLLQSLWLGKNKITEIKGVSSLSKLRQLDVQSNRLSSLRGLCNEGGEGEGLSSLSELYLAHNGIESFAGLPACSPLSTIDISSNPISSLEGIEVVSSTIEEIWMSRSRLSSFEALTPLTLLPSLTCVYLEHSPIAADFEYRIQLTSMCPRLEQIDATPVRRCDSGLHSEGRQTQNTASTSDSVGVVAGTASLA